MRYMPVIDLVEKFAALIESEKTPANIVPATDDLETEYLTLRHGLSVVLAEIEGDIVALKHQGFDTGLLKEIREDIIELFKQHTPEQARILAKDLVAYVINNPIIDLLEKDIEKHLSSHKLTFTPHPMLRSVSVNGLAALKALAKKLLLSRKE